MSAEYQPIQIAGGDTAKPLTMAKRLGIIRRHLSARTRLFLDCGCGSGDYVRALSELGLDAHGVEFDEGKVRVALATPALAHRVTRGDLEALAYPDDTWDCAMLNEVLEHVPDDRAALREVARVLRPGGLLFVFSPNRWFPFETHGTRMKRSGRRVPHWMPLVPYIPLSIGNRVLDYWARNYWQGELRALVTAAGFDIVERSYVWLTFEGISGRQPALIRALAPILRLGVSGLERTPFLKRFGVSQVLVCRKRG